MSETPEETGRQMAEALVASLELLKRRVAGDEATPASELRAGEVAVEALKALLPEVADELGGPQ